MTSNSRPNSDRQKYILVTGASGFIGTHVCALLEAEGVAFKVLLRAKGGQTVASTDSNLVIRWPEGLSSLPLENVSSIIHLAHASVKQSTPYDQVEKDNLLPLQQIIKAIEQNNSNCQLIYVSSQSAVADSSSSYGKVKYAAEQELKLSKVNYVIVKPGLVIGHGSQGIFASLVKLIKAAPVIPLIGSLGNVIQPVAVTDLSRAILKVSQEGALHSGQTFQLAVPPVAFQDFTKDIARTLRKERLFLPLPIAILDNLLRLTELLLSNPPVSRASLLGFLQLQTMDCQASWQRLGLQPEPLDLTLKKLLGPNAFQNITHAAQLKMEAETLFKSLFKRLPSTELIQKYQEAHTFCCKPGKNGDVNMAYLLSEGLDSEALELVLRKRKTVLSKKLLLLVYLAEMDPQFSEYFFSGNQNRAKAFLLSTWVTLRTVFKYVKGHYLLRRHTACMTQ